MKAIIDAVNELKGDLINQDNNCVYPEHRLLIRMLGKLTLTATRKDIFIKNHNPKRCINYVCTVEEFNDLVTKLSQASWIKGASLAEYQAADKEVLKVEGKTVEHDGMVYEIGKGYEFSNDGSAWERCNFDRIRDTEYPFSADGVCFRYCRKVSVKNLGTITPAPVNLIDGEVYHFELNYDLWVGFYCERRKSLFTQLNGGNKICGSEEASQITRLTPSK